MFWKEDEDKSLPYQAPNDVIDLVFNFTCKTLPLKHAWALSTEIEKHLPWITEHKTAGIHQIHVAESNNGWIRPDDDEPNALLYPSRRTKLTLRIPIERLADAQILSNKILNIDNHKLLVGNSKQKEFTNAGVIFARYVQSQNGEDENSFLNRIAREIDNKARFHVKKMLCGKSHTIKTPSNIIKTRHLMIADLDNDTSIKIQQLGLGNYRELGCGLFLPHKDIKSLIASG